MTGFFVGQCRFMLGWLGGVTVVAGAAVWRGVRTVASEVPAIYKTNRGLEFLGVLGLAVLVVECVHRAGEQVVQGGV